MDIRENTMESLSKALGTSFETSKAYNLVYSALDYRSLRQDLIASNMANVKSIALPHCLYGAGFKGQNA